MALGKIKKTPAAAGAVAATAAGLAYLDAKLHIRKDLHTIRGRARQRAAWARAVREGRTSLYYLVEQRAAELGGREAIWSRSGGCYTWTQLLARAHQYAQWFLAHGVHPGDLVALFMVNSPDFICAWVGLWAVGAAPAMINYYLTGKALIHCLAISSAKIVLVDGDEAARRRIEDVRGEAESRGIAVFDLSANDSEARTEVYRMPTTRPSDELRTRIMASSPMALFYTSGTTGMPKAVPLPVVAGFGHGHSKETRMSFVDPERDRWYVCMPLYHGTGGISTMAQVLSGVTVCVAPRFSASGFWTDVRDSGATWFSYVGETLRYLLAAPPSPLDRQHRVHSIYGNGLRPDVWDRFRERFGIDRVFEFFNSSEGMLALDNPSRNDFTAHAVGHHGFLLRRKYNKYYVPVAIDPETGDIIRDPKTGFATRVPYEVGGEILVAIPFEREFPGYWNDPEATDKKFVRDVFRKGDCYYRTGDALRRDQEGRWYFLDRWKGENVSTAEVSEILGRYPGVIDATVYGVQVPGHDGKAGMAAVYIDPEQRHRFDHRKFLRHARTHLPRYAVPIFLRHVDVPFATHNNKQDKSPLRKEGIHPGKVPETHALFWIEGHGKGDTYIPFTKEHWDALHLGKAKL
ncbi:hypothetical protein VTK73DRAFT_539 [Phialemonium thermophilum]|uniref:AMP-dependent synthetase/ligase domain-containing protein n=1 Tax=Phialemonium thermophilum TaxID=223376 RepID=A0ABR3XEV6_9PEZI